MKIGLLLLFISTLGFCNAQHKIKTYQKLEKRNTLKTKFKTDNGDKVEMLVEKNTYLKNY